MIKYGIALPKYTGTCMIKYNIALPQYTGTCMIKYGIILPSYPGSGQIQHCITSNIEICMTQYDITLIICLFIHYIFNIQGLV